MLAMSGWGQTLPKGVIHATSAFPPLATGKRMCLLVRFVPRADLVALVFELAAGINGTRGDLESKDLTLANLAIPTQGAPETGYRAGRHALELNCPRTHSSTF